MQNTPSRSSPVAPSRPPRLPPCRASVPPGPQQSLLCSPSLWVRHFKNVIKWNGMIFNIYAWAFVSIIPWRFLQADVCISDAFSSFFWVVLRYILLSLSNYSVIEVVPGLALLQIKLLSTSVFRFYVNTGFYFSGINVQECSYWITW